MRWPHDDPGIFDRRQQREHELPGRIGIVPVSGATFVAVGERGFVAVMAVGDEERPAARRQPIAAREASASAIAVSDGFRPSDPVPRVAARCSAGSAMRRRISPSASLYRK